MTPSHQTVSPINALISTLQEIRASASLTGISLLATLVRHRCARWARRREILPDEVVQGDLVASVRPGETKLCGFGAVTAGNAGDGFSAAHR
ncbi:MAG: hypothetical protein H6641_15070 [Caldilineaceae bacterium]|nr:hypothetical protein [Caldilineaceae bacterium]